jgi:PIN domain nuclease of toxin-antitoxin system
VSALADSCAIIVFLTDVKASATMPRAFPYLRCREVYVPPMVVWEIGRRIATGRLPPMATPLPELLRRHAFNFLPMSWEVAALAETLPMLHRDPIDRILVAHSMQQNLPILTCDTMIPRYGVPTIW